MSKKDKPEAKGLHIHIHNPHAGKMDPSSTDEVIRCSYKYAGEEYALFEKTWQKKLARAGRWILQYNEDLLKLTVEDPDVIVRSTSPHVAEEVRKGSFIHYRKVDSWAVSKDGDRVKYDKMVYLAVVVDRRSKVILTFYPTDRLKSGEQAWKRE